MKYYKKTNLNEDFIKIQIYNQPPIDNKPNFTKITGNLSTNESIIINEIYSSIISGVDDLNQFISFDIQENYHGIFNYRNTSKEHKQIRF
jgi:hypothetical protein